MPPFRFEQRHELSLRALIICVSLSSLNFLSAALVSPANRLLCGSSIWAEGVKAMKTQAWGWLAAAVVAAGLNASYHDGGLRWAHEAVSQVKHNTGAVLALATGQADQFLAEARIVEARRQTSRCPFAALAERRAELDPSAFELQRFEGVAAWEQARLARFEAHRAQMEARLAQIQIPAVAFNPVVVQAPKVVCPRVRINMPRIPAMKMPVVHVETGFGSV